MAGGRGWEGVGGGVGGGGPAQVCLSLARGLSTSHSILGLRVRGRFRLPDVEDRNGVSFKSVPPTAPSTELAGV